MIFWMGLASLILIWLLVELIMRLMPYRTGFYTSLPAGLIPQRQKQYGVQALSGADWLHLGWIADPAQEKYHIEQLQDGKWVLIGETEFGSFLLKGGDGLFRVMAVPKSAARPHLIGSVEVHPQGKQPPLYRPRISGAWKTLFMPEKHGFYINDHTLFQDRAGAWRLIGITSRTNGNYNAEKTFASARSAHFPPEQEMQEETPIADFGSLAWAPAVIRQGDAYHLFWSPHQLHHMLSEDGVTWHDHQVIMGAPFHKFFRDPMVMQVAENQWLLYTTARGKFYSQIDLYQSFNLTEWQYIRTVLSCAWGSERNSAFASTESPFVLRYEGRYYLSMTYNNGSTVLAGLLLLLKKWPGRGTYNDTLVFHSSNPYDFGVYRGRKNSDALLTRLEAHAPEWVQVPETGIWYITTAGWLWAATLTKGEVAVAPLAWEAVGENSSESL